MKMVITLKNGVQIKAAVKEFTARHTRDASELTGLDWIYDDDPAGTTISWVNLSEIVAVHAERGPGDEPKSDTQAAAAPPQEISR